MDVIRFFIYLLFRIFGFFISLLPYPLLHALGKISGLAAYFLHRNFRKKAMSNLAIAFGEKLSEKERIQLAKKSFQNVMITCLEFFRLKASKNNISKIVSLQENSEVESLLREKKGIVFLTAHQANWEIPFIAVTSRYEGVAIGRPIKNKWLYRWVLSVREMNGGKIVMPKNAIRRGLKALKEGKFLGIVGDQAFPESPYSYPLFGVRAWTASTPALLAYKAGCPLVVGATKRIGHRYEVSASPPFWPNASLPLKGEVPRLMDQAMHYLEARIKEKPDQWMWIHDRWKQQGIDHVKRKYRFGFILIILRSGMIPFKETAILFRKIYPRSYLTFYVPHEAEFDKDSDYEVKAYDSENDLFQRDWRYQLVFDFYNSYRLRRHFRKLGAFHALSFSDLKKQAPAQKEFKKIILHSLVKPECLQDVIL